MARKETIRVGNTIRKVKIPKGALWGKETALALENFPRTPYQTPWELIEAILLIKKAAAMVHRDLGILSPDIARAIIAAADEGLARKLNQHFVVDAVNAGAGTSLHININEVLATRATQILQHSRKKPALPVDPHDHVNYGQSTNDVIPTAIRIAVTKQGSLLLFSLCRLRDALKEKAGMVGDTKTAGRTHMRDALPLFIGRRFLAYADRICMAGDALAQVRFSLLKLGIGGTAIGSGANAATDYRRRMIFALRELTGIHFQEHCNLFAAMSEMAPYALMAGALEALAIELSNVAHDLSLSSYGPSCGIGELILPPVQPGSSIMPGKINPTICENLIMTCRMISGNAETVRRAAHDTCWELNPSIPLIGLKLIESITILSNAMDMFSGRCVRGIEVNHERCRFYYENTAAWPTLFNDLIGYEETEKLVAEAQKEQLRTGETMLRVLLRIAASKGIRTKCGEEITEGLLERLAFPRL